MSADNVTYYDLSDSFGQEVTRYVSPGTAILIDEGLTEYSLYFKIRSGSRAYPVPQSVDQSFLLVTI
jgi:hypothetical protein